MVPTRTRTTRTTPCLRRRAGTFLRVEVWDRTRTRGRPHDRLHTVGIVDLGLGAVDRAGYMRPRAVAGAVHVGGGEAPRAWPLAGWDPHDCRRSAHERRRRPLCARPVGRAWDGGVRRSEPPL